MKHAFAIINPVAGKSNPEQIKRHLDRAFREAGWSYQTYETTGEEVLANVVGEKLEEDIDLFIAAGGDGTFSGVAGGLVNAGVPLALIPVGTGNVLARDLDIPRDIEAAVDLIISSTKTIEIDAMRVDDRYFFMNVTTGVTAEAMRTTEHESKQRIGRLAYIIEGAGHLLGFQPHRFEIEVDGVKAIHRASEILVINSHAVGAPYVKWGEQVCINDGILNLAIIRGRTLGAYLQIVWDLVWQHQRRNPSISSMQVTQKIAIDTQTPLAVQGDGDYIGETPIEISVVPQAVNILVAANEGEENETCSEQHN